MTFGWDPALVASNICYIDESDGNTVLPGEGFYCRFDTADFFVSGFAVDIDGLTPEAKTKLTVKV